MRKYSGNHLACLTTVGILLSYEETYKMFEDFVLLKSSSIYALRHFFFPDPFYSSVKLKSGLLSTFLCFFFLPNNHYMVGNNSKVTKRCIA